MEKSNINDILGIENSQSQILEKLLVIDESVNFYSRPNVEDTNIRTVNKGDELFITKIEKINGEYWIKAYIDNAFEGYIKEGSNIAVIIPVKLNQKEIAIYQQPTTNSSQIAVIKKKEKFYLIHKTFGIENKSRIWDKVKLQNGEFGFMNSDTKVVPINKAENKRKKFCLYAVIILYVIGIIRIIALGASDAGNGGTFDSTVLFVLLGFAAWGLVGAFIWYYIILLISGLFKSKIEKYYYPNLIAIYNNQIL